MASGEVRRLVSSQGFTQDDRAHFDDRWPMGLVGDCQCFLRIVLVVIAGVLSVVPSAGAQVVIPFRGAYNCSENGFSECRDYSPKTPAIESCGEWGAYVIAKVLTPTGGPYTVKPEYITNYYNTALPTCVVQTSTGATAAWSHKWIDCTGGSLVAGPGSVLKDSCSYGTAAVPTLNFGAPCPRCGTNPINLKTGNKYQSASDYAGAGQFPLVFERYHNSARFLIPPYNTRWIDGLGNWRHTYERTISYFEYIYNGTGSYNAVVERPDGKCNISAWLTATGLLQAM